MDKIVINDVELTQEKLTFKQKTARLFKLIDAEDKAVMMYRYENGWYSGNGYIELYIDIKDIEFNKNKTLNKIKLYISQDDNIFKTVDLYGLDSLIEFINDCAKWLDKVKDAIDACPY